MVAVVTGPRRPDRWASRGPAGSRGPSRSPSRTARPGLHLESVPDDLPWPAVAGGALAVTAVGAAIGLHRTGLVGAILPVVFVVSALLAALAVRRTQMVLAAAQPPVIALLAIVLFWLVLAGGGGFGSFVLGVVAPLAGMFWWIVVATGGAVGVVVARARGFLPR